ncbi:MAG: membrane protein DedA with SNARE-associated domain [Gammaproteobacteria bacterium]
MFDPLELVSHYGYWAVAIGSILEGETFLLMGGFAAHRGLLELRVVIVVAFVFSFIGDQCYFWLGRRHGQQVAKRFPVLSEAAPKIHKLLERWGVWLILGIRFMIGLRTAGPFVMGWAGVNAWKFAAFNLIGAAFWAVIVGCIGYYFADALDAVLHDLRKVEDIVIVGIVVAGVVAWLIVRRRAKKSAAG